MVLVIALILWIIFISFFAISASRFLPKIWINSKLYFIILIISSFFVYITYLTWYLKNDIMVILVKITNYLDTFSPDQITFIYLSIIAFFYVLFTYLYNNILVRWWCISKVHTYIITLIALIYIVVPIISVANLLWYINYDYFSETIDLKSISILLKIVFLIYSIYIHVKFIVRVTWSDDISNKILAGIFVWIFWWPTLFTLATFKWAEKYVPCDQELLKENEEKKEENKL